MLGNNTLEVFDLRAEKRVHTVRGLAEPQGVRCVPGVNKNFVANGNDGACRIYDGTSFREIGSIKLSHDADNVRYDQAGKRIYVGYGDGALGVIDATTDKLVGDIKVAAHPESFQLENSDPRIFANIPRAGNPSGGICIAGRRLKPALHKRRVWVGGSCLLC